MLAYMQLIFPQSDHAIFGRKRFSVIYHMGFNEYPCEKCFGCGGPKKKIRPEICRIFFQKVKKIRRIFFQKIRLWKSSTVTIYGLRLLEFCWKSTKRGHPEWNRKHVDFSEIDNTSISLKSTKRGHSNSTVCTIRNLYYGTVSWVDTVTVF